MRCVCLRRLEVYLYSHDAHSILLLFMYSTTTVADRIVIRSKRCTYIHIHLYRYNALPYIDILVFILGCLGLGRVGDLYTYKLYYTTAV